MQPHSILLYVFVLLVSLMGCEPTDNDSSQGPDTDSLRGLTEEQVIDRLGEPESRGSATIGDPFFGPRPVKLQQGETFTSLNYRVDGDTYHVNLVPPTVYERVSGESAGNNDWRVLDVQHTPEGVVY